MNNDFQPVSSQRSAENEQALFNNELYEHQQLANQAESEQKEHQRQEAIKDELHCWIVRFIKLFLGAAVLAGAVYFWHLITPEHFTWNGCPILRLHFLPQDNLDKLRSFFVTVALSSTFTSYAKKYMK
ncbi:hypothetical protein HPC38_10315 [Pasteurellaceae bacterium HPA106]|uniref:hypothetical protein n=1 Tax=Spirabiliibacterium pneumoniae TaxID=221400 RepID=UPI001AAC9C14|nr:hypothetical protein [Spirabiliibacterium pneumoniae]MBE2897260.1 hypothetical protein [Spirabiliibacterium pneumoniae]